MTNIQRLEKEISRLQPSELAEFRAWFEQFDAKVWDKEIESDAGSGRLDKVSKQAIEDFRNGNFKKI